MVKSFSNRRLSRTFKKQGLSMSSLVLGTAQFGLNYGINNKSGKMTSDEILEVLKLAWDNDIRELDTAQDYGNSEQAVGECVNKLKKNFIVHSKFILKDQVIQDSIKQSLANLNIQELGYFYFHRFSDYLIYKTQPSHVLPLEHCLGLAVSVYEEEELQSVIGDSEVMAIQIPVNIFDCSDKKIQLIKLAQVAGKKIYIRSIFLQGLFFMPVEELPVKLQSFTGPLNKLNAICQKNNLEMRSLAFGFINTVISPDGIIIGVDSKKQLLENIEASKTRLNSRLIEEMKNIDISDKKLLKPMNWN